MSPSTSPPGGVWLRPTWRKAPSQKPVAAARPQTTTTASNPNVALWNKKQPTKHPSKNPLPLSSLFLEHHFEFFCFCFLVILAQGKNQSYPSEGGDSGSARRCFPCVSSFTAVPALFDPPTSSSSFTSSTFFLFLPRFVELKCSRQEGQ